MNDTSLRWSARMSLTTRILAVNVFAIALLAGSLFYLNNYRDRLTEERLDQAQLQMRIIGDALRGRTAVERAELTKSFAYILTGRIRIYDQKGEKTLDSFALSKPTYILVDPETEPWRKDAARMLDRAIEFLVLTDPITSFVEPEIDNAQSWSVIALDGTASEPQSIVRYATDRTPMIIASMTLSGGIEHMLLTSNARDITRIVRAERASVVLVMILAALISVLLSLFLARTIVRPIGKLARAAIRVRLGREPAITIPRMPERNDEIGQ